MWTKIVKGDSVAIVANLAMVWVRGGTQGVPRAPHRIRHRYTPKELESHIQRVRNMALIRDGSENVESDTEKGTTSEIDPFDVKN